MNSGIAEDRYLREFRQEFLGDMASKCILKNGYASYSGKERVMGEGVKQRRV